MSRTVLKLTLPPLYPRQREAIFASERYSIIEASTKSGKTVGCMVWILTKALQGQPGHNFWWIAPVFTQAMIAYRRTKSMLRKADPNKRFWESHEGERWIDINGARIWYKSADNPDSLYGEDVYAAVIDEATRVKQDAWHAVRSTLTKTEGPVRIIGNVKGSKNWAYRLARVAQGGAANMSHHKLTAWDAVDAGVLSMQEIEDAKATLPEPVFRELYLAEPADDEGNPFGVQAIRRQVSEMSHARPVAWGVDLAKHQDWCVAIGLDAGGYVCRYERWQSDWSDTTNRVKGFIGQDAAIIDSTGVGDPIVEQVVRSCPLAEGLAFTNKNKQQMMEGLAVAIQRGDVWFPEGQILEELLSFEYEVRVTNGRVTTVRYSAPEGMHDDCVCALALAVQCWAIRPLPPQMAVIEVDEKPNWANDEW